MENLPVSVSNMLSKIKGRVSAFGDDFTDEQLINLSVLFLGFWGVGNADAVDAYLAARAAVLNIGQYEDDLNRRGSLE